MGGVIAKELMVTSHLARWAHDPSIPSAKLNPSAHRISPLEAKQLRDCWRFNRWIVRTA
jgi:hypothetical protein